MIACMNCGRTNRTPNMPNMPIAQSTMPPLKLRERKSPRSIRGCPLGRRVSQPSQPTKAAIAPRPRSPGTIAELDPQPFSGASVTAYMIRARPALERRIPRMSIFGRRELATWGMRTATATRPTTITGTFIRKTQPHQKWART